MPDLTSNLIPALQAHRLPGLDLGEEFIYPNYAGHSILNIPSSVCAWLGASDFGVGPLQEESLAPLVKGVKRVILILMDALGLKSFQRWLAEGYLPIWQQLLLDGLLLPLTSVVPSTTSTALTSLWTGRSAAEHTIAGYELWLKEYGLVANMILHAPMSFRDDVGGLTRAGFQPETFLPFPTLGSHLSAQGVKPYAFQHYTIARSGLSQMLFKDVEVESFATSTDLWINLRELMNSRPTEKQFIWVYWGEVDHYSHRYGPANERSAAEFTTFSQTFERLLLKGLEPQARQDTLVLLAADHGQIFTPKSPHHDLRNHPGLVHRLHMLPTGENRLIYLFAKPNQRDEIREYFNRSWPRQFTLINSAELIRLGLFGPGKPASRLPDRLGDLVAISHDSSYLWWGNKDNPLLGRHGGLSPEEMLVPFVAVRL